MPMIERSFTNPYKTVLRNIDVNEFYLKSSKGLNIICIYVMSWSWINGNVFTYITLFQRLEQFNMPRKYVGDHVRTQLRAEIK